MGRNLRDYLFFGVCLKQQSSDSYPFSVSFPLIPMLPDIANALFYAGREEFQHLMIGWQEMCSFRDWHLLPSPLFGKQEERQAIFSRSIFSLAFKTMKTRNHLSGYWLEYKTKQKNSLENTKVYCRLFQTYQVGVNIMNCYIKCIISILIWNVFF